MSELFNKPITEDMYISAENSFNYDLFKNIDEHTTWPPSLYKLCTDPEKVAQLNKDYPNKGTLGGNRTGLCSKMVWTGNGNLFPDVPPREHDLDENGNFK